MVIKNFDNFIIEEVNKPKLSEFDLRILSYGLAECCIKAFENPEMQKKFAEWKEKQKLNDEYPQLKMLTKEEKLKMNVEENLMRYKKYNYFCRLNNISPNKLESLQKYLVFEKEEA